MNDIVHIDGVAYVRAYPVADGRCAHCGIARRKYWTSERILGALQTWAAKHGRSPRRHDWSAGRPWRPADTTVVAMFDDWDTALDLAGLPPPPPPAIGPQRRWDRESICAALLDWTLAHGHPPIALDWRYAGERYPTAKTVREVFGSWNAGKAAAGIREVHVARGGRNPKARGRRFRVRDAQVFISVERLAPVVERLMASQGITRSTLARRSGVPDRRIYAIAKREQQTVTLEVADRLLVALGANAWHEELRADYREEVSA